MAVLTDFMKQLEEAQQQTDALREQFDQGINEHVNASFEHIRTMLDTYARFLTESQRGMIVSILQMKQQADEVKRGKGRPAKSASEPVKAKKAAKSVKSVKSVVPKYQIPSGETYGGRGKPHKAFSAWATTSEGKAWRKANPGQSYPAYPFGSAGSSSSGNAKPAKKAAAKKSTGNTVKKAPTKPASKRVGKQSMGARKATRKAAKQSY